MILQLANQMDPCRHLHALSKPGLCCICNAGAGIVDLQSWALPHTSLAELSDQHHFDLQAANESFHQLQHLKLKLKLKELLLHWV